MKTKIECYDVAKSENMAGEVESESVFLQSIEDEANDASNVRVRANLDKPESLGFFKKGFRYTLEIKEVPTAQQSEEVQAYINSVK